MGRFSEPLHEKAWVIVGSTCSWQSTVAIASFAGTALTTTTTTAATATATAAATCTATTTIIYCYCYYFL